MTRDAKKNVAIAVLAAAFGISAISLGSLYMGGGPSARPMPEENHVAQAPSPVSSVNFHPTPPPSPALTEQPPDPVYEWAELRKESFVLVAGQKAVYGPIPACDGACQPYKPHLIRFTVKSTSPIDAGALDGSYLTEGDDRDAIFSNFFGSPVTLCYAQQTLESDHLCRLTGEQPTGWVLLRDSRSSSNIGALAARLAGVKEPLEKSLRENRVTLTFYQWRCLRFCR